MVWSALLHSPNSIVGERRDVSHTIKLNRIRYKTRP